MSNFERRSDRLADPAAESAPMRRPRSRPPGRQLELGNKGLLFIFISLAIVCGLFFSFGYTIGRHAVPASFTLGSAPPATNAAATKPAASLGAVPPPANGVQPPNPNQLSDAETNQTPAKLTPAPNVTTPATATPTTPAAANAAPNTTPAGPPANAQGIFQVQVFSGTQADAQSLTTALQGKGYPASVVSPTADGTNTASNGQYRVVVGPYLTRAEAEAMRSRLTADGYEASIN